MIAGPSAPGVGESRNHPGRASGSSSEGTSTVPSALLPSWTSGLSTPIAGTDSASGSDTGMPTGGVIAGAVGSVTVPGGTTAGPEAPAPAVPGGVVSETGGPSGGVVVEAGGVKPLGICMAADPVAVPPEPAAIPASGPPPAPQAASRTNPPAAASRPNPARTCTSVLRA